MSREEADDTHAILMFMRQTGGQDGFYAVLGRRAFVALVRFSGGNPVR